MFHFIFRTRNLSCPLPQDQDVTINLSTKLPTKEGINLEMEAISPVINRLSVIDVMSPITKPLIAHKLKNNETFDPRLSPPDIFTDYSHILNPVIIDNISSEFSDCNLNKLSSPTDSVDRNHFLFLKNVQNDIFSQNFSVASSIHSPESLRFYKDILQVSPFVLNVLTNGYNPTFLTPPPDSYRERNNKSARDNMIFVRKVCLIY